MHGIAENFDQHFLLLHADSAALRQIVYRIRYQVYVEEMGWEPANPSGLETDDYDACSHACLLEHRRTGAYAGCVRLVTPPRDLQAAPRFPFHHHRIRSIRPDLTDVEHLQRGLFGEISRLAVPAAFRRRKDEHHRPFVLDEHSSTTIFTEQERRSFPNIAIGLYLAATAMVEILDYNGVFVVMEPKLQRHLKRFGLPFEQASQPFEFHGQRALFYIARENFTRYMSPAIAELFQLIKQELITPLAPPSR